jgi:hypothetical protein
MSTKNTNPAVQSAQSDAGLVSEWRRLCIANGCDEDELDETEAALGQLEPELARLRISQAISRLSRVTR